MERLIKTGRVKAKNASEIKESRFGLGMEKLDMIDKISHIKNGKKDGWK